MLAPEIEPAPVLTDSDAAALSAEWRQQFAEAVLAHDLDPLEEVTTVARLVPLEHRRKLRKVLSLAGCSFTTDELVDLWANGWQPEQAINQWRQELRVSHGDDLDRDS